MNITHSTVSMMTISDAPLLDRIRVITEDYAPGQGRIIITCYTRAWTSYWGAMSGRSIKDFFVDCDPQYLLGYLTFGIDRPKRQEKRDNDHLLRIIKAVQTAMRSEVPA